MINRFHAGTPAVASNASPQARKTKAGDEFASLLNALTSPAPDTQPDSSSLADFPAMEPDTGIPTTMLFHSYIDDIEEPANAQIADPLPSPVTEVIPEQVLPVNFQLQHNSTVSSQIAISMPLAPVTPIADGIEAPFLMDIPDAPSALFANNQLSLIDAPLIADTAITNIAESETLEQLPVLNVPVEQVSVTTDHVAVLQGDLDIHVDRHSSPAEGEIERITLPWRLQANAGMSYESSRQPGKTIDGKLDHALAPMQMASMASAKQNHLLANAMDTSSYDEMKISRSLLFYQIAEKTSELANVFEASRSLKSDARGSLLMWPRRVLHWLADGETTTAWVRDYQLDASGTKTLVDALRCFADQQGFSLRRIMLNGHEVWRSPSTF